MSARSIRRTQERRLRRERRRKAAGAIGATAIGTAILAPGAAADTFTVTNLDNNGPGSLRRAVNLANGNLQVAVGTPKVQSVAGPIGVALTYNSRTPSPAGLVGVYTQDTDGDHVVDGNETPVVVRRDPSISFDWDISRTAGLSGW